MYAIFLPEAKPSVQVRAVEEALSLMAPPLTVAGVQYPDESVASLARRREAEKRVRQAERLAARACSCVWCGAPINGTDNVVIVSGRAMHVNLCQDDFDQFIFGADGARV